MIKKNKIKRYQFGNAINVKYSITWKKELHAKINIVKMILNMQKIPKYFSQMQPSLSSNRKNGKCNLIKVIYLNMKNLQKQIEVLKFQKFK